MPPRTDRPRSSNDRRPPAPATEAPPHTEESHRTASHQEANIDAERKTCPHEQIVLGHRTTGARLRLQQRRRRTQKNHTEQLHTKRLTLTRRGRHAPTNGDMAAWKATLHFQDDAAHGESGGAL